MICVFLMIFIYFSEHYERHQQDVVMQFYNSLKQIIANSIECRNLCEVVYFDSKS